MNYFHDIEYASGQYEKRMGINELIFTNSATSVRTATIQFFTEHRRNRDSVYQCFFWKRIRNNDQIHYRMNCNTLEPCIEMLTQLKMNHYAPIHLLNI